MQLYRYNLVFFTALLALMTFSDVKVFAAGGAPGGAAPSPAGTFAPPAALPGQGAYSGTTGIPLLSTLQGQSLTSGQTTGQSGTSTSLNNQLPSDASGKKADSVKIRDKGATTPSEAKAQAVESSTVEKSMVEDSQTVEKSQPQEFATTQIIQFGYNFFKADTAGFAPMTNIPVGPDYMIGVGDSIVITTWGGLEGTFELEVNRNGEIVLPKVGAIKVLGIEYGQLQPVIKANLAKIFKDFHLNVNMGKLRLMKVYLVGNVRSPGDYNIPSLSTLINALAVAGGPTKNGSLRSIQIKRNGNTVDTVDLYDFFLKGDKSRDVRLQPGDAIFVPTIGPVAGIAGNVRQPAIYELKGEKNLADLLSLADGINPGGYLQRIQISRLMAHEKNIVADFNLDPVKSGKSQDQLLADVLIQDMDMVRIFPIDATLRGYVKLEGYVLRPGNYALTPGMTIKDILIQDNILPEYNQEIGEITRLVLPDYHPEKILFNPSKALGGDSMFNLELKEFDTLKIFSRWDMEEMPKVRVSGDVQKPGEYRLLKNMTVRDLVVQAGNPKRTAFMKSAEITRIGRGGDAVTTTSININLEEALKGNPKDNLELEPFDMLMVRRIPDWAEITESFITLKGEFVFPGTYQLYKGERLSSVIRRAGGFTEKAYLPSAKFTRQFLKEMQQNRSDEILAREEINLARKQGELSAVASSKEELDATKSSLEGLQKTVSMLKSKKAEGRMVIKLMPLDQLQNSEYNFDLTGGDSLEVGIDPRVVSVFGQVYNPASFLYVNGESVGDYLGKTGGFTRDAEQADTYIINADGSVVSRQMTPFFSSFMDKEMASGDTIVVPQKIEKIAWLREIKDIATILGQIALTAGVLIAAGL